MEVEDPRLGTVLQGRYRIVERLAAGGMGIIYRGERVKLARQVAIKFLHAAVAAQSKAMKRFEREARIMARLAHPHCVSVIDVGVDDAPYIVMDYVSGKDLKDILAEGPMPAARAVHIVRQILAGLAHAHALGVVHRDIKPANIMIADAEGTRDHVYVLDFGLAKFRESALGDDVTGSAALIGTPSYMAPEQARGQRAGEAADVYSTGVLLFEMLTGANPFRSENPIDTVLKHQELPVPRLEDAELADVPADLDEVLQIAMAKEPEERFASVLAFSAALDAVMAPHAGWPRAASVASPYAEADTGPSPVPDAVPVAQEPAATDKHPARTDATAEPHPGAPAVKGTDRTVPLESISASLEEDEISRAPAALVESVQVASSMDVASADLAPAELVAAARSVEVAESVEVEAAEAAESADRAAAAESVDVAEAAEAADVAESAESAESAEAVGSSDLLVITSDPDITSPRDAPPTIPVPASPEHDARPRRSSAGVWLVVLPALSAVLTWYVLKADGPPAGGDSPGAGRSAPAGSSPSGGQPEPPGLGDSPLEPAAVLPSGAGDAGVADARAARPIDAAAPGDARAADAGLADPEPARDASTPSIPDAGAVDAALPAPETVKASSVREVYLLVREGRRDQAIVAIRKLLPDHEQRAYLNFLLGNLYFEKTWWSKGLDAYQRSIARNDFYAGKAIVSRNAIEALGNAGTRAKASRLLVNDVGKNALPHLARAAKEHEDPTVRKRAAALAARIKRRR